MCLCIYVYVHTHTHPKWNEIVSFATTLIGLKDITQDEISHLIHKVRQSNSDKWGLVRGCGKEE